MSTIYLCFIILQVLSNFIKGVFSVHILYEPNIIIFLWELYFISTFITDGNWIYFRTENIQRSEGCITDL